MPTGAITPNIDVAQLVLYAFWIFFAGLIIYLRREDKREGYPLESDRSGSVTVQGFPRMPEPKTFKLRGGRTVTVPRAEPAARIAAEPAGNFPGAPLVPTGNPMRDGVGPASYALRTDAPDTAADGSPRILPMREATDFSVAGRDPDPRGLPVIGCDGARGGTVSDIWVDVSEVLIRYLEVSLDGSGERVLLPHNLMKVTSGRVEVKSITGAQFAGVPRTVNPNRVTMLEEDKVMAYYASGVLYATVQRAEPMF